jgi:hypothetical protein
VFDNETTERLESVRAGQEEAAELGQLLMRNLMASADGRIEYKNWN